MAKSKLKTKLHFNRVNMQRGKPEVWTAHNSHGCFQAKKLVLMHDGKIVAETCFLPKARQPRAFFIAHGQVRYNQKGVAIIEV